jgi:hypothetical protein
VRWGVPVVSGFGGGYLLSVSGYGWCGAGVAIGFTVAALSAAFAPGRRLAFGLLGSGCTVIACFSSAIIRNWRDGIPPTLHELLISTLMLAAVVIVPGLIGAGLVSAIDSATRPRDR